MSEAIETIIDGTAQNLIEEYFKPGNTGFSKNCIKAVLRDMVVSIEKFRPKQTTLEDYSRKVKGAL